MYHIVFFKEAAGLIFILEPLQKNLFQLKILSLKRFFSANPIDQVVRAFYLFIKYC